MPHFSGGNPNDEAAEKTNFQKQRVKEGCIWIFAASPVILIFVLNIIGIWFRLLEAIFK